MERFFPVYTQETFCQDCYKCVRECPVKAIRVENERAHVVPDRCVACGRCVRICPSGAKRIRNDIMRLRYLLGTKPRVYASIAPSWVAVYPDLDAGRLVAALRRLGFAGVSETALGAEEVSASLATELARDNSGLHISSACPAVVDLIRKHIPDLAGAITPVASPALTHCRLLRDTYGQDIGVVFIGPCAAKKTEADENPDLLDLAITFSELDDWLAEESVKPALFNPGLDDTFVPRASGEGALYPVEGGMVETMAHYGCPPEVRSQAISGLGRIRDALTEFGHKNIRPALFLEGLACRGGCVNGPCTTRVPGPIDGYLSVREYARIGPSGERPGIAVPIQYDAVSKAPPEWSDVDILKALSRLGKVRPEDELNCSACGYDSCRSLARALLSGDAEESMCASYMRSIAQRKANALLRCMPSGVVIVGSDLRIIESNLPFARIALDDAAARFQSNPGLQGEDVENLLPIGKLLRAALRSGEDIRRERLKMDDKLLSLTVFIIEPHKIVGAIVDDVTQVEMRRDQIARRAKEVINRNITTVQEIACRLGEHMADTEILLSSIAEGFGDDQPDEQDPPS